MGEAIAAPRGAADHLRALRAGLHVRPEGLGGERAARHAVDEQAQCITDLMGDDVDGAQTFIDDLE